MKFCEGGLDLGSRTLKGSMIPTRLMAYAVEKSYKTFVILMTNQPTMNKWSKAKHDLLCRGNNDKYSSVSQCIHNVAVKNNNMKLKNSLKHYYTNVHPIN